MESQPPLAPRRRSHRVPPRLIPTLQQLLHIQSAPPGALRHAHPPRLGHDAAHLPRGALRAARKRHALAGAGAAAGAGAGAAASALFVSPEAKAVDDFLEAVEELLDGVEFWHAGLEDCEGDAFAFVELDEAVEDGLLGRGDGGCCEGGFG
eukprot:CAMPEP_0174900782 /NCGR_PEP_ID=MMETSP0167-20121228/32561_1 /TAXON_ID=38298 /ORGANISM="Rhodella maculata, Strain CCMP736" /LENGTH=150 /DNA_ID=CAMNT_0016142283 /DNA_START=208 /DNA_END=656 /DNA_ORIENTATION=-